MKNYTIDNNVLARLCDNYPRDTFLSFWEKFEDYAQKGRFILHQEVRNELIARRGLDDDYFKYIDGLEIFLSPKKSYSDKNQKIVKMIAEKKQFLFDGIRDKIHWADPWLIALAKNNNLTIITSESPDLKRDKLPKTASDFGVSSLNLNQFFAEEGWRF